MTAAQKRLRELRERQSKERQRMAELSREAELTAETRAELDRIESGTPDLERQIRAAVTAAEAEDAASTVRTTDGGEDAEAREKRELRARVKGGAVPVRRDQRSQARRGGSRVCASRGRQRHPARRVRRAGAQDRDSRGCADTGAGHRRGEPSADPARHLRDGVGAASWRRDAARRIRHLRGCRDQHEHDGRGEDEGRRHRQHRGGRSRCRRPRSSGCPAG